jgi:hypothetical protein
MDADRFDALSRSLSAIHSRRGTVRGVLAALVGGLLLPIADLEARARNSKQKRHGGKQRGQWRRGDPAGGSSRSQSKHRQPKGKSDWQRGVQSRAGTAACKAPGKPCTKAKQRKCCSRKCSSKGKCLCTSASQCTRPSSACQQVSCTKGQCVTQNKAANTPCPDEGTPNPCTNDVCNASGQCTHPAKTNGAPCPGGTCQSGQCKADATCSDTIKNGNESDVDCGGSCPTKCGNGKTCGGDGDCQSGHCCAGTCRECCSPNHCPSSTDCKTWSCPTNQCVSENENDGTDCQRQGGPGLCDDGECVAVECEPGTTCRDASCQGSKLTQSATCAANGTCPAKVEIECNDGNPCTDNLCAGGACQHPDKPDGESCNGGDTCCSGTCQTCCPGSTRPCYSGPNGTQGVGVCQAGEQTCQGNGTWGANCSGEVLPSDEVCDSLDNDCDGNTDGGDLCSVEHGTAACIGGECQLVSCDVGWADCEGGPNCETQLGTIDNCTGCGDVCNSKPHSQVTCDGTDCVYTCDAGWGDCNDDMSDGCETDLLDNDAHCGNCPTQCGAGETCENGSCQCRPGRDECGNVCCAPRKICLDAQTGTCVTGRGTCEVGANACDGSGLGTSCNGDPNCSCIQTVDGDTRCAVCVGDTTETCFCGMCTSDQECIDDFGSEAFCIDGAGSGCCPGGGGMCAKPCPTETPGACPAGADSCIRIAAGEPAIFCNGSVDCRCFPDTSGGIRCGKFVDGLWGCDQCETNGDCIDLLEREDTFCLQATSPSCTCNPGEKGICLIECPPLDS